MIKINEVHIWIASLKIEKSSKDDLLKLLSEDELKRAEKFYFQKDRNHFIACRGILRTILGNYLEIDPRKITFSYNFYGKPSLNLPEKQLSFNLSNSHGMALYGLTWNREIGIDIEYIPEDFNWEEIVKNFFSKREIKDLYKVPLHMRKRAFFNCWTRKEAYIKARGKGLSIPLHSFDVSLIPGEPAKLLEVRGEGEEKSRWHLKEIIIDSDYTSALAVEGQNLQFKYKEWKNCNYSGIGKL
ncbi:MAG TPA: 4'-phosphopantetheinyl transferase superfamily protein [Candidatus Eremiobacteraeota bacterium]|nr:MAG: 4'-phosphopantetheinyl transferase sfp [bacterium ADurb.Bin363]HPZ09763.1 4'-phosphopantetheinyl transferase superfamily protein [Candidatus Eremiobacteraeota bacterium]